MRTSFKTKTHGPQEPLIKERLMSYADLARAKALLGSNMYDKGEVRHACSLKKFRLLCPALLRFFHGFMRFPLKPVQAALDAGGHWTEREKSRFSL